MNEPPSPKVTLREAVRAERRGLLAAAWKGFRWTFLVVGGVLGLWFLKIALFADAFEGSRGIGAVVGLGYAAFVGAVFGIGGGLAKMSWYAVGGWTVLPFFVVPLTLWGAIAACDDWLHRQLNTLYETAASVAKAHEYKVEALGHAARIGPVILVIALPLLLVDLGAIVLHPKVLWELFVLAFDVVFVLALGIIPGLLLSGVVLAFVWVRRFRARHGV